MNSFSLEKNRSHFEPGQRIWSQVNSSTGCHPKCWLWTIPSPTVFAIHVRIAWQIAGWKTRNNNTSTTVSERWRNAGPSAFQLQVSMLKSDKIWYAYLVVNCVNLWTFWTPLVVRRRKESWRSLFYPLMSFLCNILRRGVYGVQTIYVRFKPFVVRMSTIKPSAQLQ